MKSLYTTCMLLLLCWGTGLTQGQFCFQGATIKAQTGAPGLIYEDTALTSPTLIRFSTRPLVSPYQYLVTDTNNLIVQISATNTIDISVLSAGHYRVWSFSFIGEITARLGQPVEEGPLASFCSGLSKNFVPFIINGSGPNMGEEELGNGSGPDPNVPILFSTVLEAIERNNLLQVLERGIENANLEDDLQTEGPFTVFAPVNNAFAALDPADLVALFDLPTTALKSVLLNHVVAGSYVAADLFDGQELITLGGETLMVSVMGENVLVGGSKIQQADIGASNGIVHLIQHIVESIAP